MFIFRERFEASFLNTLQRKRLVAQGSEMTDHTGSE